MPRLNIRDDEAWGYVLVWGGVIIDVSVEEWDALVAQAAAIQEKRMGTEFRSIRDGVKE